MCQPVLAPVAAHLLPGLCTWPRCGRRYRCYRRYRRCRFSCGAGEDLGLVMSLLQVNPELAAASLAAAPFATLDIIDTMPGCLETSVPRAHHMLHECPHDVRKF